MTPNLTTRLQPTKKSGTWSTVVSNSDTLHSGQVFPHEGFWEIPVLDPCHDLPGTLFEYTGRFRKLPLPTDAVTFSLGSRFLELFWERPNQIIKVIAKYAYLIAPVFPDLHSTPRIVRLYNIYRARWLAVWTQFTHPHIKVIPHVAWTDEESWEYAFDGLPHESVLTISEQAFKPDREPGLFELIQAFKPSTLVVIGQLPGPTSYTEDLYQTKFVTYQIAEPTNSRRRR